MWPLAAATFFMVSGGTYGTEEIVHGAGYSRAILILLITPVLWSLPTAFMIGELASALPFEGGFYAWVRRSMGSFWGFQEAWLSLAASVFDMAIYPTLFFTYMGRLFPWVNEGYHRFFVGLAVIALCVVMNVFGVKLVASTSLWLFVLLSSPFIAIVLLAPFKLGGLTHVAATNPGGGMDIMGGLLIAMWNYMGWDNASTIATEVEKPQRTYPRAMLLAVLLVAVSYLLPVGAMWMTGLTPGAFETGSWADLAGLLGGQWLRVSLVVGGMISAFGMFNALVMSYARLPLAMSVDGMLPKVFQKQNRWRAPWVSILVLAVCWVPCLLLGFDRLVTLDILVYGVSLGLEFVALAVLRFREPELPRPFKVPGGKVGAMLIGVAPMMLLGFGIVRSEHEEILGMSSFAFGVIIIAAGVLLYGVKLLLAQEPEVPAAAPDTQAAA